MQSVRTLIDTAATSCRTKRELAAKLGMPEQTLQAVINGRAHLTPKHAVALAQLLGIEPKDVLAQVVIEREKDLVERGRLIEAFFRRGTLGAVAMCLIFGATATTNVDAYEASPLERVDYLHLVVRFWRQCIDRMRGLLFASRRTQRTISSPGLHAPNAEQRNLPNNEGVPLMPTMRHEVLQAAA